MRAILERIWGRCRDVPGLVLLALALIGACGAFFLLQDSSGLKLIVTATDVPVEPVRQDVWLAEPGERFEIAAEVDFGGRPSPLALDGEVVVWAAARPETGGMDILGVDLRTGESFTVCAAPGDQYAPAISGDIVVWADDRRGAERTDIYGRDLSTGEEFPVSQARGRQVDPAISGKIVVWVDRQTRRTGVDIVGRNLGSDRLMKRLVRLPGKQVDPAISGSQVVWRDFRNDPRRADIFGCDLATREFMAVAVVTGDQGAPSVSNGIVAWSGTPSGCRDMATGRWFVLRTEAGIVVNPVISDARVVWEDHAGAATGNAGAREPVHIILRDLESEKETMIRGGDVRAAWPIISGRIVIWIEDGHSIEGMWLKAGQK